MAPRRNDRPLLRRKLFIGVGFALGFLGARWPPTEESDANPPPYDRLARVLGDATPDDEEAAYAVALNVPLTNWVVDGHEIWIQAQDGTFKELFVAFGHALHHENQQAWVRINDQKCIVSVRPIYLLLQ